MLVIFGVFAWFPIVRAFVMSVQDTNLVSDPVFVGLQNFQRVFADPLLGIAVRNTAWFAFLALVFGFPVPIILAVLMSELRSRRGLFSALAYLPVVIPPVVSVLLWRFFFAASPTGVFNTVLGWFGLGPLPWLQNAGTAMPSIVIEATWAAAGATVIIYLAALVGVRPELYDAAEVDGASLLQKIRYITLPQIRNVLFVTLILQLIATAQLFTEPLLFTGGGPANSTMTVLLLIYKYAFQNSLGGDYGMAAALSLMLAAFLAVFTAGYYWLTRRWSVDS
jgi:multiple sugar transport system permease protein